MLLQALDQLSPGLGLQHHAAVRHGHTVPIDRIEVRAEASLRAECRIQVTHELVTVEIEVDPLGRASSFGATENAAVEAPRLLDIPDLDRNVEGSQAHARGSYRRGARLRHGFGEAI